VFRFTPSIVLSLSLVLAVACEKSKPSETKPVADLPAAAEGKDAIKTVQVTENIYMLEGRGGNVGVFVGKDGVLLIDDKFEDLAEPIRAAVKALGKGQIVYVLNTHHHGDHTGGNVAFGKDATLVSHENARKHLVKNDVAADGLPVLTFSKSMSIFFNDEELKLVHLPNGHTDGDTAVYFTKSNVVHLGDNFFNGKLPFVDLGGGGDPNALLASTTRLANELPADVKLIPGHGPLASLDDYKVFREMLKETIGIVSTAKAKGASLDSVKKAGFGGKYKDWATAFVPVERWAETIYNAPSAPSAPSK